MTIYDSTVGFFAQRTSMHGVKSAYEASNRPCRCLWGGITLCMTVMAFNYGWGICYKYLVKKESITRMSYVDHGGLALPVLTICPTRNPFILQRLQERNISNDVAAFLLLMVDTPGHIAIPSDDEWRPLNDQLFASLRPGETPFDLFNSLSPRCEDMIASCFIYGSRINSSECCQDVFSDDYFVYYQSRCITTLRSRRLTALNQTRPGDYNGIGVILKDDRETFFAERDMRFSLVPAQEGNRIILTPHYILPMESVIEQTFIATVGAVTRLSVTHTVVDRTGEFTGLLPFSEKTCTDIPPHGSKTPPLSCRGALYNSEMRRVCGCQHAITLWNGDDPRKVNVCEPLDMFACQRDWQAPGHQITQVDCPHQCQKIIYDVVSDGSPIKRPMLDNEAFFGGSPVPVDTEHNSTFSVVMVFYPSLVSRVIQLSKATLMDWLSAFGGQLSLFIGASVITMLEMVFFIVRIVAVCTGGLTERFFGTPRVGCLTEQ